jgi:hypothetical protein
MRNFHITTIIKLVSRWLRSRHCMDDSVECHCFGVRLEKTQVFGPEVLKDAEKQVQMIRENLKVD